MKTHLLHRDQDFNWTRPLPANADALNQDLELSTLFAAMSAGDAYLLKMVPQVVLHSMQDPQAILYRQWVVSDCLTHPTVVQELYDVAGETLAGQRKWTGSTSPTHLPRSCPATSKCWNTWRSPSSGFASSPRSRPDSFSPRA